MSAARVLTENGRDVLVLDDQPAPGGQIYRGATSADERLTTLLGDEYAAGREICRQFQASGATHLTSAFAWQVTDAPEVYFSYEGASRAVRARHVVLASGAMERPFPVPGWTLPGVMMAGAAQTLLKSSGMIARDAVFAGSGPLLYLVAAQYLRAGAKIAAVLDTTDDLPLLRAAHHLPGALMRADLLFKGRTWINDIRASGTPLITGVSDLRIEGEDTATGISYRRRDGAWQTLASPHIFLHQGVVPNVNLSMSIGIDHVWDEAQLCWRPRTDAWGGTSSEAIVIAGDGAGISGAVAAAASGELTALEILHRQGDISAARRTGLALDARQVLRRERVARPFLDAWFRPRTAHRLPQDPDTIVCRCEELTLADVSAAIAMGVAGPNQLKSYARAGMGPCQGRFCGLTIQGLIARHTSRSAERCRLLSPAPADQTAQTAGTGRPRRGRRSVVPAGSAPTSKPNPKTSTSSRRARRGSVVPASRRAPWPG